MARLTLKHKIGLVHDFCNPEEKARGIITKCLCCGITLMFFTPYEGTAFVSGDRSEWPWEEAPKEWADYFERNKPS